MESNLNDLLVHTVQKVPRYKGILPELHRFPIVSKAEMVADWRSFIATETGALQEALVRSLADFYVYDRGAVGPLQIGDFHIEETSGTSGIPFRFPRTTSERSAIAIGIWKQRKIIDPKITFRSFYSFFHNPPGFVHARDPLDCSKENVLALYERLKGSHTRWIHSFPGLLLRHANALECGCNLSPITYAEVSGSFLSAEVADAVKNSLRLKLVNQYGCIEVLAIGYGTDCATFTVLKDNVHVDIVDEQGKCIEQPETEGRVVVTGLKQKVFPFIRYDLGDTAKWTCGEVGRQFILKDQNREYEDPARWGVFKTGARYFRTMLPRAYEQTGFIKMTFLQIREEGLNRFVLVTDANVKADQLRMSLERVCQLDPTLPSVAISLQVLRGAELELEKRKKPRLFLNRTPCR